MPAASKPSVSARSMAGLLGGLVALDLLINLPGFSRTAPIASVLVPSLDLLVVAAVLVGAAQASSGTRAGLRVAVAVLVAVIVGFQSGTRFGFATALDLFGGGSVLLQVASVAVCAAILAAAALAAFVASGPVLRAFSPLAVRSVFLLVVALAAVVQVLTGRHLFSASAFPRIARALASLLR